MAAAAQTLIVRIGVHLIELLVIVIVPVLETIMTLTVLTITETVGALRGCCGGHHCGKRRHPKHGAN